MLSLIDGKISFELEKPIVYANKGGTEEAKVFILSEPVESASLDCAELAQTVRRMQAQAFKVFFGDPTGKTGEEKEGEVIIPFHERSNPKMSEVLKDANGITEMLMMSETKHATFIAVGRKVLTSRYSSKQGTRLCVVDDADNTPVTGAMFDDLSFSDKMLLISVYISFFGISLIGQRRTISSRD
jgi:hypothetical protein